MAKLARMPAIDGSLGLDADVRVPRLRTRFYAFLNYSHQDKDLADWLHGELEKFRVPHSLAGKLTTNGIVPRRLTPIFRDQHDLAAGVISPKRSRQLWLRRNSSSCCAPLPRPSRAGPIRRLRTSSARGPRDVFWQRSPLASRSRARYPGTKQRSVSLLRCRTHMTAADTRRRNGPNRSPTFTWTARAGVSLFSSLLQECSALDSTSWSSVSRQNARTLTIRNDDMNVEYFSFALYFDSDAGDQRCDPGGNNQNGNYVFEY